MDKEVDKKGQLTIFIIVAIVIVALAVLLFIFRGDLISNEDVLSLEASSVKLKIEECMQESFEDSIFVVSLQGGYFDIPENYIDYTLDDLGGLVYVPFYVSEGNDFVPSKSFLENQISKATISLSENCFNFSNLDYNVEVDSDNIEASSSIEDNMISLRVIAPVVVSKAEDVSRFEKFSFEQETSIKQLYDLASSLSEIQLEYGNNVCMTCFSDLMKDLDIALDTTEIRRTSDFVFIYSLHNYESQEMFNFAHKFEVLE